MLHELLIRLGKRLDPYKDPLSHIGTAASILISIMASWFGLSLYHVLANESVTAAITDISFFLWTIAAITTMVKTKNLRVFLFIFSLLGYSIAFACISHQNSKHPINFNEFCASEWTLGIIAVWCICLLGFMFFDVIKYLNTTQSFAATIGDRILKFLAITIVFVTVFYFSWTPFNSIETPTIGVSKSIINENYLIDSDERNWKNAYCNDAVITLENAVINDEMRSTIQNHVPKGIDSSKIGQASVGFILSSNNESIHPRLWDMETYTFNHDASVSVSDKPGTRKYIVYQSIPDYYSYFKKNKIRINSAYTYHKIVSENSILISDSDANEEAIAVSYNEYRLRNPIYLYSDRLFRSSLTLFNGYSEWKDVYAENKWQAWRLRLNPTNGSWQIEEFHGGLTQENALEWYNQLRASRHWHHLPGYPN